MCCALKHSVSREKQFELKPAEERKYIMVIGGDIAGMEAARVSALRGHTATLVERNGELGGVFIPASNMRFKKEDKELILDISGVYHTYVPLYRGLPLIPIPPQPAAGGHYLYTCFIRSAPLFQAWPALSPMA